MVFIHINTNDMNTSDTQTLIGNIQEDPREGHNPFSARAQRAAVLEFCTLNGWNNVIAVTLSFRQSRTFPITREQRKALGNVPEYFCGPMSERLDYDKCTQNLRHFMNVINSKVYGNVFKRYGKRLRFIAVIEGGRGKRLHCHAAIDCPEDFDLDNFQALIKGVWEKTHWGYHEVKLVADSDHGWLDYMMKLRDKEHYDLSIDWLNYHNPT